MIGLIDFISKEYISNGLSFTDFEIERDGLEYNACHFKINNRVVISRDSKITPKKVGQFVTFWKRNIINATEPFNETDNIDFFMINSQKDNLIGQFVFPKTELINRGILSTKVKDGKRGFRVYPPWDLTTNKQAKNTQIWQLKFFYKLEDTDSMNSVKKLFK